MGYDYKRIDTDSHIQEKPDTWTSRMSKAKWGDRIPHVEDKPDGTQGWVMDGKPSTLPFLALCPAVMPDRVTGPKRWEEIPPSVYEASERFKAMDHDHIDAFVTFSNLTGPSGETFQGKEPEFEAECDRAYNDYVIDEWVAADPNRVIPLCIPPHSDMEHTLDEIKYSAKRGHKGVILFSTPHTRGLPNYSNSYWDPLWNTCKDMGFVINFHGSGGAPPRLRLDGLPNTEHRRASASGVACGFALQAQYFANLIFAGVMERHPDLTIVCAETGIGWVPYVAEACDHAWEKGQLWKMGLTTRPSEVLRRQVYVDFWYETSALQEYRYVIGVDRIMWETDFPHPTALWPDTEEFLTKAMEGVPEKEQHMILVENPKRAYSID